MFELDHWINFAAAQKIGLIFDGKGHGHIYFADGKSLENYLALYEVNAWLVFGNDMETGEHMSAGRWIAGRDV